MSWLSRNQPRAIALVNSTCVVSPLQQGLSVESFVSELLADNTQPVVVFSLEWCEFCWSVRNLFAKCNIAYRPIDLDSVEYQKDNLGGAIRGVLKERTGCITIPQIFIRGAFIGGCTETFDAFIDGSLQQQLEGAGVPFDSHEGLEPYTFLPKWLQPR